MFLIKNTDLMPIKMTGDVNITRMSAVRHLKDTFDGLKCPPYLGGPENYFKLLFSLVLYENNLRNCFAKTFVHMHRKERE